MPTETTSTLLTTIDGIPIYEGRSPICDEMDAAMGCDTPSTGYWNAWDNAIWCVGVGIPPWYVIEHEKVHFRQMNEYPEGQDAWWARYLVDEDFRVEAETEAYAVDIKYGAHSRDSVVWAMCHPLYGNPPEYKVLAGLDRWCGDE